MALSRYPRMARKPSAIPPPVFPLLVSATVPRDTPGEKPSATAPDPQPNKDPIRAMPLHNRITLVAPVYGASLRYAKSNKIPRQLDLLKHQYYPIEGRAALMGADPRLTSWNEVHRIGGISWEAHTRARARVGAVKSIAQVTIEPPHAEMRILPTHVYLFIKGADVCTKTWPLATKFDDIKQFVLNQDLLRLSLPGFPQAHARPGKLKIFTELNETGEEISVECRSANGVLPVTVITVPNLEGLEPVLQYCYRPNTHVVLDLLLGEVFVVFGESYEMVSFKNTARTVENNLSLELKSLRVSRRISLSQPISHTHFDQCLLSRIRFVDAVAKVAEGFELGCPGFWNVLMTARRILFNAAVYRYQEVHSYQYPNPSELEAFKEASAEQSLGTNVDGNP